MKILYFIVLYSVRFYYIIFYYKYVFFFNIIFFYILLYYIVLYYTIYVYIICTYKYLCMGVCAIGIFSFLYIIISHLWMVLICPLNMKHIGDFLLPEEPSPGCGLNDFYLRCAAKTICRALVHCIDWRDQLQKTRVYRFTFKNMGPDNES